LSQNNNKKLSFSIHELDVFYKQASTSWLKAELFVNLVNLVTFVR
jgi:hypothetical protein